MRINKCCSVIDKASLATLAAVAFTLSAHAAANQQGGSSYNWHGDYAGITLGYAFNGDDEVGLRANDISGNRIIGDAGLEGGFIGVKYGHNWHVADSVLLGLEWTMAVGDVSAGVHGNSSATSEAKMVGALKGRLGFISDRDVFYISGGPAAARIKYEASSVEGNYMDDSSTEIGYTYGVGWERALAQGWRENDLRLQVEYNYTNYGGYDIQGANNFETRATPDHHGFSLSLNYPF